jgi:hypothetical protein
VAPTGELVAVPERGTLMGNRGCLHDDRGVVVRHHAGRRWIACVLDFKGVRRPIMRPGRYTELFFLDEATALAAGHRPCAYCRRADYLRFREAWSKATGGPPGSVDAIDAVLHAERVTGRATKVTHPRPWPALPDGTLVAGPTTGSARLVLGDAVLPWSFAGYGPAEARPGAGRATVLTPSSIIEAIAAGYRPGLHPTAAAARGGR